MNTGMLTSHSRRLWRTCKSGALFAAPSGALPSTNGVIPFAYSSDCAKVDPQLDTARRSTHKRNFQVKTRRFLFSSAGAPAKVIYGFPRLLERSQSPRQS